MDVGVGFTTSGGEILGPKNSWIVRLLDCIEVWLHQRENEDSIPTTGLEIG